MKQKAKLGQLFLTGRPVTAGVFSLLLTITSLGFFDGVTAMMHVLIPLSYFGAGMSIMSYNDWRDREHDRKKGKFFASDHADELFVYWICINCMTLGTLFPVALHSPSSAVYLLALWSMGLFYSHVPHWYVMQNLIVAVTCGGAALAGAVYAQELNGLSIMSFIVFCVLPFINEVCKDIEDQGHDAGYKETIPVRIGHRATVRRMFFLVVLAAAALGGLVAATGLDPWISIVALTGTLVIAFGTIKTMHEPKKATWTKWAINLTMIGLLLGLLRL